MLNSNPQITVIIPAYKAESSIGYCVQSLLNQKQVDLEIIVIEDGVYDNTYHSLTQFDHVRHVQLLNNQGAQKARNYGLQLASYEFVMFLDADDYHEGELLKGLYEAIVFQNASAGFGCQKIVNERGGQRYFSPPENESSLDVVKRWLNGNSGPNPSAILWKTAEVKRIGGWNEDITRNQDGEIILRAMLEGCTVTQSYDGFGVYIQHDLPSISKNLQNHTFDSQSQIEHYVLSKINKDNGLSFLRPALNSFRLSNAIKAYNNNLDAMGNQWSKKWKRNGGKFACLGSTFTIKFVSTICFCLFGLRLGCKVLNKIIVVKQKFQKEFVDD